LEKQVPENPLSQKLYWNPPVERDGEREIIFREISLTRLNDEAYRQLRGKTLP